MKKTYFIFSLIILAVFFCFTYLKNRKNEIRIYPLSPYTDSIKFLKDEDVSHERRNGIQIRFYVFENADYTQKSKDKMDAYIAKYLRKEIKDHPAIYFTFYKETPFLDKDSHLTLFSLNKDHLKDKFAEYEYINAKLFNFDFYKDGEYYIPPPEEDDTNN
ncbi:hypothetical protein KXQ82_06410 [Mucilaginibacter sp. HMF5004]|uniref:hypothetical protein n=1 Tax=Mucilaginibacter rivuli TaxID=2857527 RepID=UPI001C5D6C2B|nr:hypothetical protein [Mucilaginibacter rivuli]MBW4889339.1 hypothetical protein [Mucilaginibacter rivuli]